MTTDAGRVAHTEGPWAWTNVFTPDGEGGMIAERLAPLRGGESVVAATDRRTIHVSHADARLIASAPELLAALRALLADWEELAGDCPPHLMPPVWQNARAAIRKALGTSETPAPAKEG